jgi:hypothetical protein
MYGHPFRLSGTLPRAVNIDDKGNPIFSETSPSNDVQEEAQQIEEEKTALKFFNTRNILNGIIVHFVSYDRGVLFYSPIVLFGLIGSYFLYKNRESKLALFFAVILFNIIFYSMWGDPWGGWAFGSRYLIPSYAVLALLASVAITKLSSKRLFLTIYFIIFTYSVSVNTLGALTSNTNPPSVEIQALQDITGKVEKYTYERNLDLLLNNSSKSFFYSHYASKYLFATQYYLIIVGLVVILFLASASKLNERELKI